MRILKFRESDNTLVVRPEDVEDLWSLARVVFSGDAVKGRSLRKFKSSESDKGEMKEVTVSVRVERTELDANAERLRFTGKIIDGKPLQYIRIGSYHTINAAAGEVIEIRKDRWPSYLMKVVKNAVADSRKPRLGIVAMDDEKAQPACLLGHGIDFKSEIYSRLSKRMSQKEFREKQEKYFNGILSSISLMDVNTVIIAGPGFTKDEFRKYAEDTGKVQRLGKKIVYMQVSNAERTGVYELIRSDEVEGILRGEHIRKEFILMEGFLRGLASHTSRYGSGDVMACVKSYEASTVLVNDSVLSDPEIQGVLSEAERSKVKVEVFSSNDEVGVQLHSFKDIACVS